MRLFFSKKDMDTTTATMPIVALRGLVVFPGSQIHFDVGRPKSIAAFKAAMTGDRSIFLVCQKQIETDDPTLDDIFEIGVIATVRHILKLPGDDGVRVAIEGVRRGRIVSMEQTKPFLQAQVAPCPMSFSRKDTRTRMLALFRQVKERFDAYAQAVPDLPVDIVLTVIAEKEAAKLSDYIAGNIMLEYTDKQPLLEELNPAKRLEKLCVLLERECRLMEIEDDINDKVQEQLDKNQREYYLREQMRIISGELGDGISSEEETQQFREKIRALGLSEDAEKKLLRECDRMDRSSPQSPENAVSRAYLETVLALPWNTYTKDKLDVRAARRVLDRDHYGMDKVKERILETLAVRKLSPDIQGQILCLVGPPGVGKTSIARSVAEAMGRKYVRISLGGVHDEAEIRGHRKTYIGSMPGRILAAMQTAGSANPLMLLDEVDKLGNDYKGDPSSALLEVLDSAQNFSFRDHYIEIPFDLSRVFFITTANDRSAIPQPLLDRMEVIELPSYTHEEKFQIAKKHLIPRQLGRHGLSAKTLRVRDDAIHALIEGYTKESGVRTLEREIASLCRKACMQIAQGTEKVVVRAEDLPQMLGPMRYKNDTTLLQDSVGVVNGLAWTAVGGEMLQVEAAVLDGTGKLELTGSLGDVMKESAKAAVTFVRAHAAEYGIPTDFYKTKDIHIHAPEGAVPKDGPSAGVTMTTALVSALSGRAVRGTVAMTGEITLNGRVLPIGGLREKTMAAYRAGISTVIIPKENECDLQDVDAKVRDMLTFVPVNDLTAVLDTALVPITHTTAVDRPVSRTAPQPHTRVHRTIQPTGERA
ncbi:MAG: endopeptidase La [Clostridia bacterium]|nr:endopeptidase La [Clostridia bacterium]